MYHMCIDSINVVRATLNLYNSLDLRDLKCEEKVAVADFFHQSRLVTMATGPDGNAEFSEHTPPVVCIIVSATCILLCTGYGRIHYIRDPRTVHGE